MVEVAYVKHPVTGKTVQVRRGESGYRPCKDGYEDIPPERLNKYFGVTEEQAQKCLIGSMFGWDVPGAQGIDGAVMLECKSHCPSWNNCIASMCHRRLYPECLKCQKECLDCDKPQALKALRAAQLGPE